MNSRQWGCFHKMLRSFCFYIVFLPFFACFHAWANTIIHSREVIIITDRRNQIDCLQFNHSKLKTPLEGNFKVIKAWQTTLRLCSPCSSRRTWWLGHQNASSAHVYPQQGLVSADAHSAGLGWGSDSCKCTPSGGGGVVGGKLPYGQLVPQWKCKVFLTLLFIFHVSLCLF